MLQNIFLPVIERLSGKKLTAIVAGLGESVVSERTVRNWSQGKGQPSPEVLEAIAEAGRNLQRAQMLKQNWSQVDIAKHQEDAACLPGFVSTLIHSMSTPFENDLELTLKLAVQIEETSISLRKFRADDQIRPFVDRLLNAVWIQEHHFSFPESGVPSAAENRKKVIDAVSWDDLVIPLKVIAVNLVLQLLATLDLEFCARYLRTFAATPVFVSLMPRLDPKSRPNDDGTYPSVRDLFHIPVRRLLEVSASLRWYKLHGTWPADIPSVIEMERWMQTDAATLTKWRMGRRFTLADFYLVWSAMFNNLPTLDRPSLPIPLVFAVTLLTQLYVKGTREKKDISMIIPDHEIYKRWWTIQHDSPALSDLKFGAKAWMPSLA